MRNLLAHLCANALLMTAGTCPQPALSAAAPSPAPRVEARSADLLAVGIVNGEQMTIHLSRLLDNSPVRDATLTVLLRGNVHPTIAEADGSYTMHSKDLALPGSAGVIFQTVAGGMHEELKGGLEIAGSAVKPAEDKNSVRQLSWWVLNFAVCIGFLMLWSRRRKAAEPD